MKKTNKKLLLSLTVLSTPFVAENIVENNVASASETYNLTQNANVYTNAQNAASQVKSTKTYTSGTYYVYKEYNGMINISRTKGKPGAWINPSTNKPVETPVTNAPVATTKAVETPAKEVKAPATTPVATPTTAAQKPAQTSAVANTPKPANVTTAQTQKQPAQSNTYTLNNSVKTYSNAAAAKSQQGAKSTYTSGNYFIFKEFNGMMNISRVSGKAGAWINPAENKAVSTKEETKPKVAQKSAEVKAVTTTKKVDTPKAETKPATIQKPAEVKAPAETKKNETQAQQNSTAPKQGDEFILKYAANTYSNAVDATNKKNSRNTYGQGTYYVYKTHNGMVNISRTRGKAGAWINPNEKESTAPKASASNELAVLPFANTNYKITSPYGVRRSIASIGVNDIHNGVDFVTSNSREAILATEDGVVTGSGYWPYDGSQYVTIKHSNNSFTSYWHLALNSITVKAGDKVKAGQKIGTIGSTGPSTGIHLHFMHSTTKEWWNTHQDPMKYLRSLNKK